MSLGSFLMCKSPNDENPKIFLLCVYDLVSYYFPYGMDSIYYIPSCYVYTTAEW